jgi:ADP-ribose pyrophosphatase YjhB (NUDIX family)
MKEEYASWRLPAAYLKEGEHPDHTAMRILKQQLGLRKYEIRNSSTYSFHDPSTWYRGKRHWDICFVYDVKTSERVEHKPWYETLAWLPVRSVRSQDLGSAHGDLARVLRLTK